mgnify:CR=1 FL=1
MKAAQIFKKALLIEQMGTYLVFNLLSIYGKMRKILGYKITDGIILISMINDPIPYFFQAVLLV